MDLSLMKKQLDRNGFALYKKAFSLPLINKLIEATNQVLLDPRFKKDLLRLNNTQHVHKILYMFEKEKIFLEALVSPAILNSLQTLYTDPEQIVPTWEDMLIKVPYNGIRVDVHQDLALQSMRDSVFSLGIYLHASFENPVYYLPESHLLGPLTKTEIHDLFARRKQDFVPVHAEPGDMLIHNVKTVHYSEENTSSTPRYTWYLEFRTQEQLKNDSPWNEDWIYARRAIWAHAIQTYAPHRRHWISDWDSLTKYLDPINLRISHTNEHIQYDPSNPYNHFSET